MHGRTQITTPMMINRTMSSLWLGWNGLVGKFGGCGGGAGDGGGL
jgi:hypothetical protein